MSTLSDPVLSRRWALALVISAAVAVNLGRTAFVPDDWHLALNLALSLFALAIATLSGLRADQLGLSRESMGAGLRLGAIVFASITAVVVVGAAFDLVTDDRADVSVGAMLIRVFVLIPLGTVFVEEILFRSVLHALIRTVLQPARAVFVGSVLFGLWHVFPAQEDSGSIGSTHFGSWVTVLGTFVATSLAGWALLWLRNRSNSLIAPALAHLATNSVTFFVAWLATGR